MQISNGSGGKDEAFLLAGHGDWVPFRGEFVVVKCEGPPWLSPQAALS